MFTAERGIFEPYGYDMITLSGAGQTVRMAERAGLTVINTAP